MTLSSWLGKKALVSIIVAAACYLTAASLGILPEPVKDFVSWIDRNTDALIFLVCFVLGCYVILNWRKRRKGEN